jgi:hypothetical protein
MVRTLVGYAVFGTLGVMLGVTAVDLLVGSESTIGRILWQLF